MEHLARALSRASGIRGKGGGISIISLFCHSENRIYFEQGIAEDPGDYFSVVKNYLISRWKDKADRFKGIKDSCLRKILERTVEVEVLRKEVQKHIFPEGNMVSCFRLLF
jgi:hypothetical protein